MEPDDVPRGLDPLIAIEKQDLDPLSDADVTERIARLEREIGRCRHRLDFSQTHRAAADQLFKRP